MPAKVIIQLEADASGLTPGIDAVEKLGKVDKATADQFKAANKAFQDRGKALDQSAAQTEKFAQATKKLVESIAGGAINQATENIKKHTKEVEGASADYKALNDAVALVKKQLSNLDPNSEGFSRLEKELQAAELAMGKFEKQANSSRAQLKQYKEALTELEEGGFEGTKVFDDLAIAAGQLDDQLGDTQARIKALASDTFKFDAAIQAIQGIAGGFAVAQGAAALFGEESEEVQQALLKVNAAMAILQGLQQIQNVLQAQSAVSLAGQITLQKIAALQTNLQSAAESRFIVVRGAAAVAQRVLNTVMAANPAGAVLFAIAALATAIVAFTSDTNDAAEAQERLNKSLEFSLDLTNRYVEAISDAGDVNIARLEAEGATEKELREASIRNLQAQLAEQEKGTAKARANFNRANQDYEQRRKNDDKISKEYLDQVKSAEDQFNNEYKKSADLRKAIEIAELNNTRDTNKEAEEDRKERLAKFKEAAEADKKALQKFLRDQVAANEIAAAEATDSFRKFEAEVQVIQARLRQTLANPDLGSNERILAEIQAGQEILKIRQDLFGELNKLETSNTNEVKKNLNSQVLASAQAAQQRLLNEQAAAQARIAAAQLEEQKKEELKQQIREAYFQGAVQLTNTLSQITQNANQAELQSLQEKLDKGLISQKTYDQQVRILRRQQAQQEKQMALFQVLISTAAAVAKALPNIPLSVLAGILGAAQIAAIASQPIPAFRKGTKNAPQGPALVGEAGPELLFTKNRLEYAHKPMVVDLNRGDKVIPAFDTARIMSGWNVPVPAHSYGKQADERPIPIIDYGKIGQAVGKQLKKLPINSISMDERGYSERQLKQYQLNNYVKNRYKRPR